MDQVYSHDIFQQPRFRAPCKLPVTLTEELAPGSNSSLSTVNFMGDTPLFQYLAFIPIFVRSGVLTSEFDAHRLFFYS